jgi:anti-sigma B factor antagonist
MNNDTLALGPELTIAFAAASHQQLVEALARGTGTLALDLAGVTEFDSAGLQLLLAARRSLTAQGRALRLLAPSAVVRDALVVFGLHPLLAEAA